MTSYEIEINFRGKDDIIALVHDFGDHSLVHFTDSAIIQDFTGQMEFRNKKYVHGYIRSSDVKDLATLVAAVEKKLR